MKYLISSLLTLVLLGIAFLLFAYTDVPRFWCFVPVVVALLIQVTWTPDLLGAPFSFAFFYFLGVGMVVIIFAPTTRLVTLALGYVFGIKFEADLNDILIIAMIIGWLFWAGYEVGMWLGLKFRALSVLIMTPTPLVLVYLLRNWFINYFQVLPSDLIVIGILASAWVCWGTYGAAGLKPIKPQNKKVINPKGGVSDVGV